MRILLQEQRNHYGFIYSPPQKAETNNNEQGSDNTIRIVAYTRSL